MSSQQPRSSLPANQPLTAQDPPWIQQAHPSVQAAYRQALENAGSPQPVSFRQLSQATDSASTDSASGGAGSGLSGVGSVAGSGAGSGLTNPGAEVVGADGPKSPPASDLGAATAPGGLPTSSDQSNNSLDTGLSTPAMTHCPHCQWDLKMPDGVGEPSQRQKLVFVQALLSQRCFTDEVELLGGQLLVEFRSLTIREIDAIYQQAFRDRESGRITTELDFWERVNRYRLYLQLRRLRSTNPAVGLHHDLPEGLSPDTNAQARTFWQDKPLAGQFDSPLVEIETKIMQEVLPTEGLFRVVHASGSRFNRLVAKLEAMVDHSDFWKPTVPLP